MLSCFDHGSGIIIMTAWGRERPASTRNSGQWSNMAEALPSGWMMGRSLGTSSPKRSDTNIDWRACIQFTFPRSVLISPLWIRYRYGWARAQLGNVFVLNREWTSMRAASMAGSDGAG